MAGVVDVYAGSDSINLYDSGNWSEERDQYVGLRFQIIWEVHYGWARLSDSYSVIRHSLVPECCLGQVKVNLSGYAYETNPGQSIAAGDTGGAGTSSDSDPDKRTLGTLALGAVARPR